MVVRSARNITVSLLQILFFATAGSDCTDGTIGVIAGGEGEPAGGEGEGEIIGGEGEAGEGEGEASGEGEGEGEPGGEGEGEAGEGEGEAGEGEGEGEAGGEGEGEQPLVGEWPEPNPYSWDGSWTPADGDFPLAGLLDDEYDDGHVVDGSASPILPPGAWDWQDPSNDLANWHNFEASVGGWTALVDDAGRQYGWRLDGINPDAVSFANGAMYYEGSSGADIVDLGPGGEINSIPGNLGEGPDVLVFRSSHSLDYRTGSSVSGARHDDDLVVAGCGDQGDASFDILTTTIHTGPGRDWVFIRDLSRAAVDLGNGADGRTDAIDPDDGDDLVDLRGNTHDFRVYGGRGDDVVVWHVDDNIQSEVYLGPNFFGGGGVTGALWEDPGTDRLVMDVPIDTQMVDRPPTPDGGFLTMSSDGNYTIDAPTADDPYAVYCIDCGVSDEGRKTVLFEYNDASGTIHTGYFAATAFEELQIGLGPGATVYRIDDVNVALVAAPDLAPIDPPSYPDEYCR